MIPLRDHNPSTTTPWVTYLLLVANILVFFNMMGMSEGELENFIYTYAVIPKIVSAGAAYLTIFTAMFLHGSLGHLFGNMIFLHIFGDNLEDTFGHFKYLLFYILCGVAATLLQVAIDPLSDIPNLGASGAIAGLMGGYLTLFPRHKIDILLPLGGFLQTATVPAMTMLLYWIGAQFLGSFGQLAAPDTGGVAYFAHIGGFIAGVVITYLLRPNKQTR